MCTYKILKAKAKAFDADPEVKALLAEQKDQTLDPLLAGGYTRDKAQRLTDAPIDAAAVARCGPGYERLDPLLVEHLLGVRG
jgi:xylose isomerase